MNLNRREFIRLLGLASAGLLADLLLQRPTALDAAPYLPELFLK